MTIGYLTDLLKDEIKKHNLNPDINPVNLNIGDSFTGLMYKPFMITYNKRTNSFVILFDSKENKLDEEVK